MISEGAKYGSLLAAVSDTNSEKSLHPVAAAQRLLAERRTTLDTMFLSHDLHQVNEAILREKVVYVVEDSASGSVPDWSAGAPGGVIFRNRKVAIWKVR